MTREEAIQELQLGHVICSDKYGEAVDMAIKSLEAWDEVMKDVQDWQDDFNTHVKLLALTDEEKEATMAYGEDVVNIIGNHMVELKEAQE